MPQKLLINMYNMYTELDSFSNIITPKTSYTHWNVFVLWKVDMTVTALYVSKKAATLSIIINRDEYQLVVWNIFDI